MTTGPVDNLRSAQGNQLVADIAAGLLGTAMGSLDARIDGAMQALAHHLDADRTTLFQGPERAGQGTYTHLWCRPGVTQHREVGTTYDMAGYPWLRRKFMEDGNLHIHSLDELPAHADLERKALQQQGVAAIMMSEIRQEAPYFGALGVQLAQESRTWSASDYEVLSLVAQLVAAALTKRRSAQALEIVEGRQEALLHGLPDPVFIISAEGTILDVHAPSDIEMPVTRDQLIGAQLGRLLPRLVVAPVLARIRETIAKRKPQTVQYMLPVKGKRRYFEVRFAPRPGADVVAIVRDISARLEAEHRLKEQEKLYEVLMQTTLDAIILSNPDGKIISWNPGAQGIFLYSSEDMIGQNLAMIIPGYEQEGLGGLSSFMASGKSGLLNQVLQKWGLRRDGTKFPVEVTLSAHTSSGETLLAFVIRDITARHTADLALRESEARYRRLVHNSGDGILLHDEAGRLLDINQRTVEMLGYSHDELMCMNMTNIEKDTLAEVHRQFWKNIRTEHAVTIEGTLQRRDGSQFPVEMRLAKFQGPDGGELIMVIARDITDRRAVETDLLDHREQLRRLASQLTLTEEQQRRELALQLHDGIGQELAMCRLRIQTYQKDPNEIHLGYAMKYVQQAITRVQSLTFDISPPALHELGLASALRSLGRRIEKDHGILFEYEESGEPTDIPKALEILLFRSVRELAINVVKHAGATTLRVSMRTSRAQVEIQVADDGIGIDRDGLAAKTQPAGAGFGLFSVKERLSSMQGSFEVHEASGTVATIAVPLDEETPYAFMLGEMS